MPRNAIPLNYRRIREYSKNESLSDLHTYAYRSNPIAAVERRLQSRLH